jgi:hypothetical protein
MIFLDAGEPGDGGAILYHSENKAFYPSRIKENGPRYGVREHSWILKLVSE